MVNVKEAGEHYRCNVCGNEVDVTKAGGGELVCCGQPMELLSPAAGEKAAEAPVEATAPEMGEAPTGVPQSPETDEGKEF
jgi:desulfoferrodoxin-like iron-binding protein